MPGGDKLNQLLGQCGVGFFAKNVHSLMQKLCDLVRVPHIFLRKPVGKLPKPLLADRVLRFFLQPLHPYPFNPIGFIALIRQ
ncbi:hypothetical protein D3C73_1595000 [compost metagenome]